MTAAIPDGWSADGVRPVGDRDLGGHPAFKLTIKEADGRWLLYASTFWHPGLSIVDVTDPAEPELVALMPGPENTATFQVDLKDDIMVTSLEKIFPGLTAGFRIRPTMRKARSARRSLTAEGRDLLSLSGEHLDAAA